MEPEHPFNMSYLTLILNYFIAKTENAVFRDMSLECLKSVPK